MFSFDEIKNADIEIAEAMPVSYTHLYYQILIIKKDTVFMLEFLFAQLHAFIVRLHLILYQCTRIRLTVM